MTDANTQTLQENTATGFCFRQPAPEALQQTLDRTLELYSRPDEWTAVMKNAMSQNFDWHASAEQYVQLYNEITR